MSEGSTYGNTKNKVVVASNIPQATVAGMYLVLTLHFGILHLRNLMIKCRISESVRYQHGRTYVTKTLELKKFRSLNNFVAPVVIVKKLRKGGWTLMIRYINCNSF